MGLLTVPWFRHDDILTRQISVSKGSLLEGPELWQEKGPSAAPNADSGENNTRSIHQTEERWWLVALCRGWGHPHGERGRSPLFSVCSRITTGSSAPDRGGRGKMLAE